MHRIIGSSKPKAPKATIQDSINSVEDRTETNEKKIEKLDVDIKKIIEQMKRAKTPSAKNALKQKAIRLARQKKTYEMQNDKLGTKLMYMESICCTQSEIKDATMTAVAMKTGVADMQRDMKRINVDKLEDYADDMQELMYQADEISDIFSRNYNMPEMDDAELEAEFDALGESMTEDTSYLDEAFEAPSVPSKIPAQNESMSSNRQQTQLDEFGLPSFK